jgi:NAD(P)H-quinone oxidoreductase subunit 5
MNWFSDFFLNNLWLVPLYPLLAFLSISIGRAIQVNDPKTGEKTALLPQIFAPILTMTATGLGLLHAISAIQWLFAQPHEAVQALERNWTWLSAGNLELKIGTLLDANSVLMLTVVTVVSLLIQYYTHGYMRHDKGYAKFFGYLALFNFSMLGLVLATNLPQMYMFWELVGVSSYLLIGFWFHKPAAAAASLKAFLVNRVGDFGFLIGILFLLFFSLNWWQGYVGLHPEQALLSFQGFESLAGFMSQTLPPWLLGTIAILIFAGPMAKSAQFPLHTWLPDAMEGPTPISALIHAATMVAAGVYLIARVFPIISISPDMAMPFITWTGVITAVVGAIIAVSQADIKKALAYSTMSQLGFMVAAMGLGAYTAGLFHLFTHAFFKAMLFLCSGSVIHACEDEQDMRQMGGLFKKLPFTGLTYLIGTIAISGLFWTSGFWSKDEILAAALHENTAVYVILTATAGLTAFYMFRTFFMTFMGDYRGKAHVHHEDKVMTLPLQILAVPSIFIGLVLSGFVGLPAFGDYITYSLQNAPEHHPHSLLDAMFNQVGNISQLVALVGVALSSAFYYFKVFKTDGVKTVLAPLYNLSQNKFYMDDIYDGIVEGGVLLQSQLNAGFDKYVIDGLVNLVGTVTLLLGKLVTRLNSGRLQTYVATIGFGVVGVWLLYQWMFKG